MYSIRKILCLALAINLITMFVLFSDDGDKYEERIDEYNGKIVKSRWKITKEDEQRKEFIASLKKLDESNLDSLTKIIKDGDADKAMFVYSRLDELLEHASSVDVGHKILSILVEMFIKDTKNNDTIYWILTKYPKYFTDQSKNNLLNYLADDSALFRKRIIQLIGIANIREAAPRLSSMLKNEMWLITCNDETIKLAKEVKNKRAKRENLILAGLKNIPELSLSKEEIEAEKIVDKNGYPDGDWLGEGWYARLALARMGYKEHVESCIKVIDFQFIQKNHPSDSFLYLTYIRQPETIEIMIRYLFDDNTKSSLDNKTPISILASHELSRSSCINGYPETKNFISIKEITEPRKWLKQKYSPHMINSLSVLIDGTVVNNLDSSERGQGQAPAIDKVKVQQD